MITGKIHTMELDVTSEQLLAYERGDKLLQDAFPQLDDGEREFIKTGITQHEWDEFIAGDEND
jgi:hypothetical protein